MAAHAIIHPHVPISPRNSVQFQCSGSAQPAGTDCYFSSTLHGGELLMQHRQRWPDYKVAFQSNMELTSISTQAYSPGAGVVPFLYSSEIFPQVLRGRPYSLALRQEP